MGHGVTHEETFANQLEFLMEAHDRITVNIRLSMQACRGIPPSKSITC